MKNVGLHARRLINNPEEQRFAEAWEKECELGHTLSHLIDCAGAWSRPPDPTDREREIAATVIQWLGSAVGHGFLSNLGYERRR